MRFLTIVMLVLGFSNCNKESKTKEEGEASKAATISNQKAEEVSLEEAILSEDNEIELFDTPIPLSEVEKESGALSLTKVSIGPDHPLFKYADKDGMLTLGKAENRGLELLGAGRAMTGAAEEVDGVKTRDLPQSSGRRAEVRGGGDPINVDTSGFPTRGGGDLGNSRFDENVEASELNVKKVLGYTALGIVGAAGLVGYVYLSVCGRAYSVCN